MTRRQAGIIRDNKPTRATKRGSLDQYCRSMRLLSSGSWEDAYGKLYRRINGGLVRVNAPSVPKGNENQ